MKSRRGIALISTLLLLSVLAVMTTALIGLSRETSLAAVTYNHRQMAQGAAEAGVAYSLSELCADRSWDAGFPQKATRWGFGSYDVTFGRAPNPYSSGTSINNLSSDLPADGPRGPKSIPAHTALLVVRGSAGGQTVTIEAIVGDRELTEVDSVILAEEGVSFTGPTEIVGFENLAGDRIAATVHSNRPDGTGIQWIGPLGSLNLDGDLSTTSSGSGAVSLAVGTAAHHFGNIVTGVERKEPPQLHVQALVNANQGATPLQPMTFGLNTLAPGKYYASHDVTIQGDLVLQDGVELYVKGNLLVNGSLSGQGTVVVDGMAELFGTSVISSQNRLALLATGDVELKGFDGSAWLSALPGASPIVHDIDTIVGAVLDKVKNPIPQDLPIPTDTYIPDDAGALSPAVWGNYGVIDRLNHELHWFPLSQGVPYDPVRAAEPAPPIYHSGMRRGRVRELYELVLAQPSSPTQQFVLSKIFALDTFVAPNFSGDLEKFAEHPALDFDSAINLIADKSETLDSERAKAVKNALSNILRDFNANKIGHAYFNGFIYTDKNFRAHSELIIFGSVVAAGGEISTADGTEIVYMDDYFQPSDNSLTLLGQVTVRAWAIR